MKLERLQAAGDWRPSTLFWIVLALIFSVEVSVMLVLPYALPGEEGKTYYAILDACLLTSVLSPLLWRLVVVPLQVLAATRLRLLDRIMEAQEAERGRIARDLHDSLGQLLTCLQVGLRAVEESTDDAALRVRLQALRDVGSETHNEIRRISSGLRPTVLDDVGLQPALERHCEDVNRTQAAKAVFSVSGQLTNRLPRSIETTCYRIVQEATTNSLRHGHATEISISMIIEPLALKLIVKDNGDGFDPQVEVDRRGTLKHVGLWSIRERVGLLGGTVSLESDRGAGTTLSVSLPVNHQEVVHGEDSSSHC